MYGDFAEPFDLYECQLAIIHCGSHDDAALIESLWQNIIDKGMSPSVLVCGVVCVCVCVCVCVDE